MRGQRVAGRESSSSCSSTACSICWRCWRRSPPIGWSRRRRPAAVRAVAAAPAVHPGRRVRRGRSAPISSARPISGSAASPGWRAASRAPWPAPSSRSKLLKWRIGHARLDRAAPGRAARRGDRGRADRLLFRRPRRHDLRHADRPAVGRRFRRRHAAPSGAALRSRCHGGILGVCSCCCCAGETRPCGGRGSTCSSRSMRSSGLPGNSSSPTGPWSGRLTCSICCRWRWSLYALVFACRELRQP